VKTYEYPFYLIEERPFMKVGKLQAAVYWGANNDVGNVEPFHLVDDWEVKPTHPIFTDFYNPAYFTKHYKTPTDIVLSFLPFRAEAFTIDLSRKLITFFEEEKTDPYGILKFTGKKAYLRDELMELPSIVARVGDTEVALQVDIGDRYSILPPEVLKGREPVGEDSFYMFENDKKQTRALIYEVPLRLSYNVTITVKARCMSPRETGTHTILGTHGCIGVDLIRNNAVTFSPHEFDPRIKKLKDVLYFNPFQK
jgi:hypothetical protein